MTSPSVINRTWHLVKPIINSSLYLVLKNQKATMKILGAFLRTKGQTLRIKGFEPSYIIDKIEELTGTYYLEGRRIALMTGRSIVLEDTDYIEDLRKRIDLNELSESFPNYVKELWGKLLSSGLSGHVDLETIICEELLHWELLKSTSILALIDGISWAIRAQQIALTEAFHRVTGFPRSIRSFEPMSLEDALKVLDKYATIMNKLQEYWRSLANYLGNIELLHQYLSHEIALFVEPVTWAALKLSDNIVELRLKEYFCYEEESERARGVYDLARECINKKGVDGFISLARKALDIPSDLLENHSSGEESHRLFEVIKERFNALCEGKDVETSSEESKTHLAAWMTALDKVDKESLKLFVDVLTKNPSAFRYIVNIVRRRSKEGIYSAPSIFIYDKDFTYVYDPWTGITSTPHKMTVPIIGTLEDLVGDLPLTLRGFTLSLQYSLYDIQLLKKKVEERGRALSCRLAMNEDELKKLIVEAFKDMMEEFKWPCDPKYLDKAFRNEDEAKEVSVKFFKSWLYIICRLGKISGDVLGGLHGLYRPL